ncbi:MAG: Fe-S protein assembly co-chaperone HscB [Fluviibacter sp.]
MSEATTGPGIAITADLLGADFFTLLGLPKQFGIDLPTLDERFRQLQREVHPDRFAAADDAARRASMMLATQINAAYQTLRSPLKRATYLLEQAGVDVGAESNTAMAPEFLMNQMLWREQVADARMAKDAPALTRLQAAIADDIEAAYRDLAIALDQTRAPEHAVEGVRRLMFLEKLREEIEDALFALEDF